MDADLQHRLETIERKIDAIFISAEKTRRYFLMLMIGSAVAFVLPLVGLLFAVPSFIATYSQLSSF